MSFECWYMQLIRTVPECIAMVALGTALVRVKYMFKEIMMVGVIISLVCLALHQLPIQYGIHIPLGIIAYTLLLTLLLKLSVIKSAAAVILAHITLILIESMTVLVMVKVLGYPEDILKQGTDPEIFLFSLPSLLIFCLAAAGAQVWLHLKYRGDATRSA